MGAGPDGAAESGQMVKPSHSPSRHYQASTQSEARVTSVGADTMELIRLDPCPPPVRSRTGRPAKPAYVEVRQRGQLLGAPEHQHRRPSSADHRRQPSTAQVDQELVRARHRRPAVALVQPVPGRLDQEVGLRRQRVHQQRRPGGVGGRVDVRHGIRQQPTSGRRLHRRRRPRTASRRSPAAPGLAPRRPRHRRRTPARSRRRSRPPHCRDGLRSRSRAAASTLGSGSAPASPRAASRPATMAAEDEPRPRPWGNVLCARSRSPGARTPRSASPRQDWRTGSRWDSSRGIDVGALTADLDGVTGLDHLELDPLTPVQREPEAVEARADVGTGRRDSDRGRLPGLASDRATMPRLLSRPGSRRRRPPRSSSAGTISAWIGPREDSAVSMSLRPWPVTVITIC